MEKPLDRYVDETMNTQGVIGAMVIDKHGLCLAARGCTQKQSAGSIASIVQQASKLCPSVKDSPVVCLESEAGNMLIKSHEDVTMVIYKVPS